MKKSLVLITLTTLVTGSVWAGPDVIIRERAKELRDQNNVRQGVAPPTQAAQPGMAANAPAAPTMALSLRQFQTDWAGIKTDSQVTPQQKQKMTQEVLAAALAARPSPQSVSKLIADLAAAAAEKPLSATSRARFTQELDAVLNPGKYPQAKLDGILRDVQAIFQENGSKRAQAVVIAEDVKAIATEVQNGGAK